MTALPPSAYLCAGNAKQRSGEHILPNADGKNSRRCEGRAGAVGPGCLDEIVVEEVTPHIDADRGDGEGGQVANKSTERVGAEEESSNGRGHVAREAVEAADRWMAVSERPR